MPRYVKEQVSVPGRQIKIKILAAFFSGWLLFLSFPAPSFGSLAWVSFLPLFWAVSCAHSRRESLVLGFFVGLVFFVPSLHWLSHVTVFGWIFLASMEALFVMAFAVLVYEGRPLKNVFLKIAWVSVSWSVLEFVRSEMPVFGLGWNLLAYSQSRNLWILQSANMIGAYGLGFLIMMVNITAYEFLSKVFMHLRSRPFREAVKTIPLAAFGLFFTLSALFSVMISHGAYHFSRKNPEETSVRISLLQGNIPQVIKWEAVARDKIIELYSKLTQLASFEAPDLIIWPEASFPGYFNQDPAAREIQALVRQINIPVLIGSPHFEDWESAYNSAYLIGPAGDILYRYDKLFLVPFGEYVPLKTVFGWLEPFAYSLGVSDFKAGKELTVFRLPDGPSFAVLICFEDVFSHLARSFVRQGARFLAVITNDAWFGRSAAPYQHMQASVLRAVENGVPVVRAANTGVSAFISSKGVILDRVADSAGSDIFVFGKKTLTLPLSSQETFYQKGGYLFPYFVLILFVTMALARFLKPGVFGFHHQQDSTR